MIFDLRLQKDLIEQSVTPIEQKIALKIDHKRLNLKSFHVGEYPQVS